MIGVLGGGQLGRMLAWRDYPGPAVSVPRSVADCAAASLGELICGDYQDPGLLPRFVEGLDLVTYEFENVPLNTARWLAGRAPVYPPPEALEASQNRVKEKTTFQKLDIPTPAFAAVSSRSELKEALSRIGLPAVLKTCRFGYDGNGQRMLESEEDVEAAWQALRGVPLILEKRIHFSRELSLLAVRSTSGETACYPLVENQHRRGILRLSRVPALEVSEGIQAQATDHARKLLEHFRYVGVLAIEFFQVGDTLIANEMAPRVHNSGHWTIEGARTSQFANHLTALHGWPLGPTDLLGHSAMVNIIGIQPPPREFGNSGRGIASLWQNPQPDRKLGTSRWLSSPENKWMQHCEIARHSGS